MGAHAPFWAGWAVSPWHEDARRVDLVQVAAELGIDRTRDGRLTPCPACGERTRSRTDPREGPVFVISQGRRWKCGRCSARGDALDLVARVQLGSSCDSEAVPEVRGWFAARGWCPPDPESPCPERVEVRAGSVLPLPRREPAPQDEVQELWASAERVTASGTASSWLRSRALDPYLVEERDLCRVLPVGALPTWAQHWAEKYPCPLLVPLYGPSGELVGVQGRRVDSERPKSVAAAGVRRVGVYADPTGIALLRWGQRPAWWLGSSVVIAEGEPDFLSWATRYPDPEVTEAPAVFGFPGSGAWTEAESARLPAGLSVAIRAHRDDAGLKYSARIAKSLPQCRVFVQERP